MQQITLLEYGLNNPIRKEIIIFRCERCGHTWRSRMKTLPLTCPGCRSPYWNRSRKK